MWRALQIPGVSEHIGAPTNATSESTFRGTPRCVWVRGRTSGGPVSRGRLGRSDWGGVSYHLSTPRVGGTRTRKNRRGVRGPVSVTGVTPVHRFSTSTPDVPFPQPLLRVPVSQGEGGRWWGNGRPYTGSSSGWTPRGESSRRGGLQYVPRTSNSVLGGWVVLH